MKKNKLNKEEKLLQEKLNQVPVTYNPSHWEEMQEKLDVQATNASSSGIYVKVASIFLIGSLAIYLVLLNYTNERKEIVIPKYKQIEYKESTNDQKKDDHEILLLQDTLNTSTQNAQFPNEEEEILEDEILFSQDSLEQEYIDSIFEFSMNKNSVVSTDSSGQMENTTKKGQKLVILYSEYPCLYSSIFFTVKNRAEFKELKWKIDGEYFPGEYKFFEAGKYLVSASAKKDGELHRDSTWIEVKESESFDFTYQQMEGIFNDFKVQFKTQTNLPLTWLIEDHEILAQQPSFVFPKEGLYDVTVYSVNEKGCTTEVYKPVSVVQDFILYSADAFTPNGDGINDGFLPPALMEIEYPYNLSIYTASGKELFSTNQKGLAWNGKYNNKGESMPIGNYIWKVDIWDGKGNQRQFMGQVKIVKLD